MKKHLSKQQQSRIDERRQSQQANWQTALVVSRFANTVMLRLESGEQFPATLRQNIGNLVVGDYIKYSSEEEGVTTLGKPDKQASEALAEETGLSKRSIVVESIEPRRNALIQPINPKRQKCFVANVDYLILVCAPSPPVDWLLLDTFLAAAAINEIEPLIVFNKVDLDCPEETTALLKYYSEMGYPVYNTCALSSKGIDQLQKALANKTSVFAGQSGVGKSSLSNRLVPHLEQQTSRLTPAGMGAHTTSSSRMFDLTQGGHLIDSPGIREFRLNKIDQHTLEKIYIEFPPFSAQCKFRNCQHKTEPHCGVVDAVKNGEIAQSRYKSFQSLCSI